MVRDAMMDERLPVSPMHLSSMNQITLVFKRNRATVQEWYRAGAPITFDGQRYDAEYNALQRWTVEYYRKKLSTPSGDALQTH